MSSKFISPEQQKANRERSRIERTAAAMHEARIEVKAPALWKSDDAETHIDLYCICCENENYTAARAHASIIDHIIGTKFLSAEDLKSKYATLEAYYTKPWARK